MTDRKYFEMDITEQFDAMVNDYIDNMTEEEWEEVFSELEKTLEKISVNRMNERIEKKDKLFRLMAEVEKNDDAYVDFFKHGITDKVIHITFKNFIGFEEGGKEIYREMNNQEAIDALFDYVDNEEGFERDFHHIVLDGELIAYVNWTSWEI